MAPNGHGRSHRVNPRIGSGGRPGRYGIARANQYLWLDQNHLNAIPEQVTITGVGGYGVVGWWLNNMRVSLYEVPDGTGNPDWSYPLPLADFQITVDADFLGDRLTTAARNESLFVFDAGFPDPIFSDWFSPRMSASNAASQMTARSSPARAETRPA